MKSEQQTDRRMSQETFEFFGSLAVDLFDEHKNVVNWLSTRGESRDGCKDMEEAYVYLDKQERKQELENEMSQVACEMHDLGFPLGVLVRLVREEKATRKVKVYVSTTDDTYKLQVK